MEYKISKLGNIIKINNDKINLVIQEESSLDFQEYILYLKNNGVVENSNLLSEEEINLIKIEEIEKLKKLQYEELKETDWYYIRKLDTGELIPLEIEEIRTSIRSKYNKLIEEL